MPPPNSAGAQIPIGDMARRLYEEFVEKHGGKGRDFSAVLLHLSGQSGAGEQ